MPEPLSNSLASATPAAGRPYSLAVTRASPTRYATETGRARRKIPPKRRHETSPRAARRPVQSRLVYSRREHVGRHAKMPRQGPHVFECQLTVAAQNHRAQVAAATQKA